MRTYIECSLQWLRVRSLFLRRSPASAPSASSWRELRKRRPALHLRPLLEKRGQLREILLGITDRGPSPLGIAAFSISAVPAPWTFEAKSTCWSDASAVCTYRKFWTQLACGKQLKSVPRPNQRANPSANAASTFSCWNEEQW